MTLSGNVMHKGEIDALEPGTGRVDDHPSSALITALDSARDYATASRSEATWRACAHDWQRFASWCAAVGQTALPASATTIGAFLATAVDLGRAAATLTRRLAAIRVVHHGNISRPRTTMPRPSGR